MEAPQDQHSRDFLEDCIKDYNKAFGTNFNTNIFYRYYKDLQKKIKSTELDLVIVVNMFLTGFDSKTLNTLYVDKNLNYHGLVQAYSRTNRLYNSDKPHGNIVSFRNLKKATDKALALYGDENAQEIVFKKPYEEQKKDFQEKLTLLKEQVPTLESVDDLMGEEEQAEFVKKFRDLLRVKSSLETYAEFSFEDVGIDEQEFFDYQSKYLDLYQERKVEGGEGESVLNEIDFEIELTVKDVINFDYIIQLIAGLKDITSDVMREKKTTDILKIFDQDIQLRKKKDLIRKFIEENLPKLGGADNVEQEFQKFWQSERSVEIRKIADSEKINLPDLEKVLGNYLYTQRMPHGQQIVEMLPARPGILERESVVERIKSALQRIVEVFEW